jgi:rhamnosyltransferase
MKSKKLVSIIIRTKNEERWISSCLESIFAQTYKNFEIIIVDNNSADKTIEKAKQFKISKIINIKNFLPGKAINMGIKNSKGEYVVILSAHAIPTNNLWLEKFVSAIEENKKFAGVYGRQEPMSFSAASDKRDMLLVFGLDRKYQTKDSFFHNANSIIRRKVWNQIPFDEKIKNIEDRIWGQEVLNNNYKIMYEPEASVYHYHGIHQDGNSKRLKNVVKIIESKQKNYKPGKLNPKKIKIISIIPVRGLSQKLYGKPQLSYTVKAAKKSNFINDIFVSTDSKVTASLAKSLGAKCPFIRPKKFSDPHVNLETVQKYSLNKIEQKGFFPDLIVHLEQTFPFRSYKIIDEMILQLLKGGYDTVIAARREVGSMWYENKEKIFERIDKGDIPREFKDKTLVGLQGLCCVTHPEFIRKSSLLGKKIGLFEIKNQLSCLEIRDNKDKMLAEQVVKNIKI